MASDATALHNLAGRAVALGEGPAVKNLFSRLTDITGADDPDLAAKLAAIPDPVAAYIVRRLCELIEQAP